MAYVVGRVAVKRPATRIEAGAVSAAALAFVNRDQEADAHADRSLMSSPDAGQNPLLR